jgi:hypothetical protein
MPKAAAVSAARTSSMVASTTLKQFDTDESALLRHHDGDRRAGSNSYGARNQHKGGAVT